MKQKCLPFLLCLSIFGSAGNVNAQMGIDTTFSFYFHIGQASTDMVQHKALEIFLKSINNITAIRGFADTTGSYANNKKLAHRRAMQVHQLLPAAFQKNVLITAPGETDSLSQLWQNRRVDVVAAKNIFVQNADTARKDTIQEELNVEHILFLPDVAVLTEASFGYVKALAQQLQSYNTEKFGIVGHVNYQSKLPPERLKDLYELSEARAKTVYDLLVQYGISATRMTYKGVGNSQPVYAEPINEEQKRKNMRVQVLILRH